MTPSLIARSIALRAALAAVLEQSRALIWHVHERRLSEPSLLLRPIAGGADPDTALIIEALVEGGACLECLVSATGLPEPRVISSLRRLSAAVILTVGLCSRCGGTDRLLCRLAR